MEKDTPELPEPAKFEVQAMEFIEKMDFYDVYYNGSDTEKPDEICDALVNILMYPTPLDNISHVQRGSAMESFSIRKTSQQTETAGPNQPVHQVLWSVYR